VAILRTVPDNHVRRCWYRSGVKNALSNRRWGSACFFRLSDLGLFSVYLAPKAKAPNAQSILRKSGHRFSVRKCDKRKNARAVSVFGIVKPH
jgi:hypothetical protein